MELRGEGINHNDRETRTRENKDKIWGARKHLVYLENWRMPSFITVVGKLRSNPIYTQEPEKGLGSGDWMFFLK